MIPYWVERDDVKKTIRLHYKNKDDSIISKASISQKIRGKALQKAILDKEIVKARKQAFKEYCVRELLKSNLTDDEKAKQKKIMQSTQWEKHCEKMVIDSMTNKAVDELLDLTYTNICNMDIEDLEKAVNEYGVK